MSDSRPTSTSPEPVVLHLTSMVSTKYGGIERYILETTRRCRELGYRSVVQYEAIPQSAAFLQDLQEVGAQVDIRELRKRRPLRIAGQLRQLFRSVKPTIIHTYFPTALVRYEVTLLAKWFGVAKTIAMVLSAGASPELPWTKRLSWRIGYNRFDQIICISHAIADGLRSIGVNPQKIVTHYMGVFGNVQRSDELRQQVRSQYNFGQDDPVFACIAFDTPFKGLDVLLRSFAQIKNEISAAKLMIIGVDPDVSKLPALAEELGVAPSVRWVGIRDEAWQVLNGADIYVQPSRFAEGLSIATIEAMALRLPVVATKVAGPGEIVLDGETGFLCEPDNVDSLAQSMQRMASQPDLWPTLGQAGQRRYEDCLQGEKSVRSLVNDYYLESPAESDSPR